MLKGFAVRGSRFAVRGSRFAVRGSRFAVVASILTFVGSQKAEAQTCGGALSCSYYGDAYSVTNSYNNYWINALAGYATYGCGVRGTSYYGPGVRGVSTQDNGVTGYGNLNGASGVYGETSAPHGIGAAGRNPTTACDSYGVGVLGDGADPGSCGAYAGFFAGTVYAQYLIKAGGSFLIDHPVDPAGKNLAHSFVESPDMKNLYDGIAVLDSSGQATVSLPTWFEALNSDFRYQLTCVGGTAPVYVSSEISGNKFSIAGGTPGLKVSWQVTGTRHDRWAMKHRIPVEFAKPTPGKYLNPELFGLPRSSTPPLSQAQAVGR